MDILVIGNGGREHALIWKLKQSRSVGKIYCTLGNAGINKIAEPVNIKPDNISEIVKFAEGHNIGLTVVGPEVPLSIGTVDELLLKGLKAFGPSKQAAMLETSKIFAKEFMKRHNIPTAKFERFNEEEKKKAIEHLDIINYPLVIKADGLAAGKGVIICQNKIETEQTIHDIFDTKIFGSAGNSIVVEEFLIGNEASVFAICDGKNYIVLPPAQDHKKILDGEKGKNTGGMGSFAPADKIVTDEILNKVKKRIIEPVLRCMNEEGHEFKGCLYCGLMIDNADDPYVVEFNVRFGDPETQVVIPLIESDLLDMLLASSDGRIKDYVLKIKSEFYCSVVLASKGYPDKYETGKVIKGLDKVDKNCIVFHAGTKSAENGEAISTGGRVLNVVGRSGKSLKEAIENAYKNIDLIDFENKYYRKDIGKKGLRIT
jgi:phosphoribosylamine--glycine ligase